MNDYQMQASLERSWAWRYNQIDREYSRWVAQLEAEFEAERAAWADLNRTGITMGVAEWLDTVDTLLVESVGNEADDPTIRGARREVEQMIRAFDDIEEVNVA
jgi:hypothetical protein